MPAEAAPATRHGSETITNPFVYQYAPDHVQMLLEVLEEHGQVGYSIALGKESTHEWKSNTVASHPEGETPMIELIIRGPLDGPIQGTDYESFTNTPAARLSHVYWQTLQAYHDLIRDLPYEEKKARMEPAIFEALQERHLLPEIKEAVA